MEYDHRAIDQRWQQYWKENKTYKVSENTDLPKYYVLDMFPYPSGAGLHVGHPLGYIATDIFSRYKRLKGYNVLHPMGFDAFGLPAEQYAIQTGNHPGDFTKRNMDTYKRQLGAIGFNYDWDREVVTCEPNYYKWTQWIFIQLFNSWFNKETNKAEDIATLEQLFTASGNTTEATANGHTPEFSAADWAGYDEKQRREILMQYRLAYQSYTDVNWCEELGTVLANDEVQNGFSVRGGHPVTKKTMRQWSLRITAYAERLLHALDALDWSDSLKDQQRNWIGRSEGATVFFHVSNSEETIEIFTTRPDTIFGATYMVLAPEHPLVDTITTKDYAKEVAEYREYVASRSDLDRQQDVKKVTGCFTGAYAVNPFTEQKIPVWIGEYVLMGYGTGAIMAVPSDDERDKRFAEKFRIPIIEVIDRGEDENASIGDKSGVLKNSGFLNGMSIPDAIQATLDKVEEMGIGTKKVNYRLRDAGFSRQRYWGEPFPVYYKDDIPYVLDESELPLELPEVESYQPTGQGSPLSTLDNWKTKDGYPLETDTMPGYAGSSWYFLRYMDPNNPDAFVSKEAVNYWQDVDLYIGGSEHAVGHLLYSRFWHKFLYDKGLVPTKEPFRRLVNQGMITGLSAFGPRLNRDENTEEIFEKSGLSDIRLSADTLSFIDSVDKSQPPTKDSVTWDELRGKSWNDISKKYTWGDIRNLTIPGIPDLTFNDFTKVSLGSTAFVNWDTKYLDENNLFDYKKYSEEINTNVGFVTNLNDNVYANEGRPVEKMSKSKLNVVNPDDIIDKYGADVLRLYEMFLGPIELSKPWNTQGIDGVAKFMKKFWRLFFADSGELQMTDAEPVKEELKVLHKTIKKIQEDVERLSFNTCVSAFMICVNELTDMKCHKKAILQDLTVLLSAFAPHTAEELWQNVLKQEGSVVHAAFPKLKEEYLIESTFNYPVSINGKVRAHVELEKDIDKELVQREVLKLEAVSKWIEDKEVKRFIYVPGRIINIVV